MPKRINDGAYVTNLDKFADAGTHWIALHCRDTEIIYIDSFLVEYVSKEIQTFIGHKIRKANIFRIQANSSIMCGYFCIGLISFMFAGKTLIDFTSLLSPSEFQNEMKI